MDERELVLLLRGQEAEHERELSLTLLTVNTIRQVFGGSKSKILTIDDLKKGQDREEVKPLSKEELESEYGLLLDVIKRKNERKENLGE